MSACPSCGAECDSKSRFCAACGRGLAPDSVTRTDARGARNALTAAIFLYLGTFAALFPAGWLLGTPESDSEDLLHQLVTSLAFALVGLLGVWRLGSGSFRESLAGRSTGAQLAIGAATGIGVFAFNVGLISAINWMLQGPLDAFEFEIPSGLGYQLIATAVLPSLLEEWLCRGVLWTALRRLTDARATILLTAALFALLHGLNGAGLLELPTRFALGVLVGILRHRMKSLLPCMACHFVNNMLALFHP